MKNHVPIYRGSATFVGFYILNTVLRLLSGIVVAQTVGAEGKGIYTLIILSNALVVLLSNPGLNTAISYYAVREQSTEKQLLRFALYAAIILGFGGGLLAFAAYQFVLRENVLQNIPSVYILIVLAFTPLSLITLFGTAILLGQRKINEFNIVETTRLGSILVLQISSTYLGFGVQGIILAFLSGIFISTLVTTWYLHEDVKANLLQRVQPIKPIITYGLRSYPTNLLSFINYRLDAFLVNFFADASHVGLYATSVSLAEMLWIVPNAVSNTLFVQIPKLKNEDANQLTGRIIRMTTLIMVIAVIIASMIGPIVIPILFGKPFQSSIIPFIILLPGVLGVSINRILSADFNGRGKPQYSAYATGISAMVTVTLDVLLIPVIGIIGAAIASSTAYLIGGCFLIYWFVRETSSPWQYLLLPQKQDFQTVWDFFRKLIRKWFLNHRMK